MTDAAILNNHVTSLTGDALAGRQVSQLEHIKTNLTTKQKAEIDRAAEDFESVFLAQMLKPMFQELSTEGTFGGGHAEEIWRGVMIDEMSKEFAKTGGIGVADVVREELIKLQGNMIATQGMHSHEISAQIEAYKQAPSNEGQKTQQVKE